MGAAGFDQGFDPNRLVACACSPVGNLVVFQGLCRASSPLLKFTVLVFEIGIVHTSLRYLTRSLLCQQRKIYVGTSGNSLLPRFRTHSAQHAAELRWLRGRSARTTCP